MITNRFEGERGPAALAELRSGDYQPQFDSADSCVACFLDYELDSAAALPVGGEGKRALGALLRAEDNLAELRQAVWLRHSPEAT